MKLHQLSNGNWIDLKTVTTIQLIQDGETSLCKVVIFHRDTPQSCGFATLAEAKAMRDDLAARVNAA